MTCGSDVTSAGVPRRSTRPRSRARISSDTDVINGMSCSMMSMAHPVSDWMRLSSGPRASVSRWAMPEAGSAVRAPCGDVGVPEHDASAVVGQQTGDEVEHRRLAGAVGPDEPEDLVGRQREAHVVDGRDATETPGQAVHLEDRRLPGPTPL